ncbi:MAG TPA: serine/threonine-protein kinase [Candidatus Limnocylindria bacterium]
MTGTREDTELLAAGGRAGGDIAAGRYRLMSLIGVGGTADVWRAHDERRGRTVTLKILRERDDPAIRRAFLAEAEILDSLTHPGIIPVLGIHDTLGITAIVFAHVEGESLAAADERRPFEGREVAGILIQLGGALASLHRRGFVHLDLKPANILFSPGSRVRLLDFGIAEPIGQTPQRIRGTPRYVAPEIRDGAPATPKSDVYGLAIVASELLGPAQRGPRLSRVLARGLSPEPADRHHGTRSFATAFAYAVLADDEIAAARVRIGRVAQLLGAAIGALARTSLPAAPSVRPRAVVGTLIAALWVMAVAIPPFAEVAAVTGRESATVAPLVAAPFALPPLRAYGARFEAQAPYPTASPAGRVEWVVALRNTGSAGWYRGVAGAQASLVLDDGTPVAVQTTGYVGPGQVGWFVARLSAPLEIGTHIVALHPRIDGRGRLPDLGIQARLTVTPTRAAAAARR